MTHTKDEALKLEALVKEEMRYYHDGHYLDSSDAKYQLLSFAHRISKSVRASTLPAAERQWVGLTDDAKLDLISDAKGIGGRVQSDAQLFVLLDMQEAKLKEKNT